MLNAADTETCPRHPRRDADPVLCADCTQQARNAVWRLPEQHRQLLGVRHATRTRTERRGTGGEPPSISPWFDHADDIARTLQYWANNWAAHLGATNAAGDTVQFGQAPSACAAFLLDSRHGDPFTTPAADELARAMTRLHREAARLLGDVDTNGTPAHRRAAGPCPECEACALYRTDGSDRIRCRNCPASLTPEEYAAYAHALAAAHRGAA
jgi:hypothetical protein